MIEGTAFDVGKPRERPPGDPVDSISGRSRSTGLPVVNGSSKMRTENGRLGRGWVSVVGKKTRLAQENIQLGQHSAHEM